MTRPHPNEEGYRYGYDRLLEGIEEVPRFEVEQARKEEAGRAVLEDGCTVHCYSTVCNSNNNNNNYAPVHLLIMVDVDVMMLVHIEFRAYLFYNISHLLPT